MSSIWTIRRSATDAKLTGLCGGVARYWGIDPVLVRVGAVLLALSGGIGVVLYVAGWLLVPTDHRSTSILHDMAGPAVRKWPKEAWVVIVVVACFVVFAAFGFATPFGVTPAIVLALLWYFGYYKNRAARSGRPGAQNPPASSIGQPPSALGPATPFTQAADAWRQRMAEVAGQGQPGSGSAAAPPYAPAPSYPPARPYPAPPPARPPAEAPSFPLYADAPTTDPRLADPQVADASVADASVAERAAFLATPDPAGLYTASAAGAVAIPASRAAVARTRSARRLRLVGLIVLGATLAGLGVADASGVPVHAAVYVGAALLVVGLTLIAATWLGRARGILPMGVALLLVLAGILAADVHDQSGPWNRTATYNSVAALPSGCEEQELGSLTVDLSQLEVTRATTYCARVDVGRLEVLAPANTNVRVQYAVGGGVVVDNGEPSFTGTDLSGILEPPTSARNRPTLTLDLSVELGQLVVQR